MVYRSQEFVVICITQTALLGSCYRSSEGREEDDIMWVLLENVLETFLHESHDGKMTCNEPLEMAIVGYQDKGNDNAKRHKNPDQVEEAVLLPHEEAMVIVVCKLTPGPRDCVELRQVTAEKLRQRSFPAHVRQRTASKRFGTLRCVTTSVGHRMAAEQCRRTC